MRPGRGLHRGNGATTYPLEGLRCHNHTLWVEWTGRWEWWRHHMGWTGGPLASWTGGLLASGGGDGVEDLLTVLGEFGFADTADGGELGQGGGTLGGDLAQGLVLEDHVGG